MGRYSRSRIQVFFCFTLLEMACIPAQAKTVTYFLADPQGTPLAQTDANGIVVQTFEYSPYGAAVASFGTASDSPGYTGHINDADTGLVYMQARYQDPVTGRFLSSDPAGLSAGDTFSFNRYGYANNNPTSKVDPDGRNAIVTYRADGSINIAVPVNFSNSATNAASIASMKADVAARWTGVYNVGGQITKVDVAIVAVTSATPKQAINNITLVNGPTSDKASQGASFVSHGNSGEWNVTSPGMAQGEAAHETGHLMGDKDYYVSGVDANGNRTSSAMPTYSNNLMGALGSVTTDGRNMNAILNNPNNVIQHEPPPPPPPPPPIP